MERTGQRVIAALVATLVIGILLFAAYTWFVLTWSYSTGERAGYVQKFSKKGWLCKTWEGEMALISMPGTVAEKFHFSVRDETIARQINASVGRRVVLDYEQHVGVPTSCFGETQYFIAGVRVVEDDRAASPPMLPAPTP